MTDLLALSTRIIEKGIADEPINRINHELSAGVTLTHFTDVDVVRHALVTRIVQAYNGRDARTNAGRNVGRNAGRNNSNGRRKRSEDGNAS